MTRGWCGIAVAWLLVGATACGAPLPTPGPAPPAPTEPNRYGAPPVGAPRDVTPRAADPCATLLTPTQIEALDYAASESERTILGAPVCIYRDGDSRRSAHVTVEATRDRLVDAYRARVLPIFMPTVIGGLPATHEQSFPEDITCTTVVGVAEGQAIVVDTSVESQPVGPPLIDPCEDGARVAEAVVSTLPPA